MDNIALTHACRPDKMGERRRRPLRSCGLTSIAGFIAISGCNSDAKREDARSAALEGHATPSPADRLQARISPSREFDEDAARDAARDSLTGLSYEDSEGAADCADDCGGHNAGWQHAQEGDDCDAAEPDSYEAGCDAYEAAIQRKVELAKEAFDRGDNAFLKRD